MSLDPEKGGVNPQEQDLQTKIRLNFQTLVEVLSDEKSQPADIYNKIGNLVRLRAENDPAIAGLFRELGEEDPQLKDYAKQSLLAMCQAGDTQSAGISLQTARALKLDRDDPEMAALMEETDQWLHSDEPLLPPPPPVEPARISTKTVLQPMRWVEDFPPGSGPVQTDEIEDFRDPKPLPEWDDLLPPRPTQTANSHQSAGTPDTTELRAAVDALKNIRNPTPEQIAEIQQLADDLAPPHPGDPMSSTTMDDLMRRHEEKPIPAETPKPAEPAEFDPAQIRLTPEQEAKIKPLFDEIRATRQKISEGLPRGSYELEKQIQKNEQQVTDILHFPPSNNPASFTEESEEAWIAQRSVFIVDLIINHRDESGRLLYRHELSQLFSQADQNLRLVLEEWLGSLKSADQMPLYGIENRFDDLLSHEAGLPEPGNNLIQQASIRWDQADRRYQQLIVSENPDTNQLCRALAERTGALINSFKTRNEVYSALARYLNAQAEKTGVKFRKNNFGNLELYPDTEAQRAAPVEPIARAEPVVTLEPPPPPPAPIRKFLGFIEY